MEIADIKAKHHQDTLLLDLCEYLVNDSVRKVVIQTAEITVY